MIKAPWTDAEVLALTRWQKASRFHSFTCPQDHVDRDLVATPDGWRCPICAYKQDWAHDFMLHTQGDAP